MKSNTLHQRCILLVDDSSIIQTVVTEVLESFGCAVINVWNGLDGLEAFESHRGDIDIVLSDLRMPVMDGFEMIRHIREADANIPIVVMSTHANAGTDTSIDALGVSFFPKPPNIDDLYRLLAETLAHAAE